MLCDGEHVTYSLNIQELPCKIRVSPLVKKNRTLLFMKANSIGPLNLGEALYSKGKSYFDAGKYDSAIIYISQALKVDSGHALWYYCRGGAHKRLKQYDNAVGDFTRGIALDTANLDAYFNRGDIYFNMGKYREAVSDFTRAIWGDPEHFFDAYYLRGAAKKKMNDSKGACEDYKKAKSLNPGLIRTYQNYCG
jgi:tetratricopeptide (TPR) repeat protein